MIEYNYKLSIIIPMYNAEKYIANCLESILNSDLPKDCYEVIIINDGSIDNGPEIAQEYVSRHDNFVYLSQENQGQSVARNNGIREAKGEYIWFVDSDDMIYSKLDKLFTILKSNNVEVLISRMTSPAYVNKNNNSFKRYNICYDCVISGKDVLKSDFTFGSVCVLFLKRAFLLQNGLYFIQGRIHEDSELVFRVLSYAQTVMIVTLPSYLYVIRENSTTTSLDEVSQLRKQNDVVFVCQSLYGLSEKFKQKDYEIHKILLNKGKNILFGLMITMYKNRYYWNKNGFNQTIVNSIKSSEIKPLYSNNNNLLKRIITKLLCLYFKID